MKSAFWPDGWRGLLFASLGAYVLFFSESTFELVDLHRWLLGLALLTYGLWRFRRWLNKSNKG